MSDLLVRGLSPRIHRGILKMAEAGDLSLNQMVIRLLAEAVEMKETQNGVQKRRSEAIRRIEKLREELHRRYGHQEDSTKIIREFRDNG